MTFQPVIPGNSYGQNLGQVNNMIRQLNKEQITKAYKQPGGHAILEGKLPHGGYGTMYYDENNIARVLIGIYDGRPGIWISKDGKDVIDELSA